MADLFKSFTERVAPKERPLATPPPAQENRHGDSEPYEAFGTKDKTHRLDVRCENGLAHSLAYAYLVNITYDRRDYTRIFLTGSGLVVNIKGKRLRPIVDALKLHTCEFIQAFDADAFPQPTDAAAPLVQNIVVEVIRGPDTVAEASKVKEGA